MSTSSLNSRRVRAEGGFSMIELIMVVLIVSVLMAIVIATAGGSQAVSRQKAMRSVAEQVQQAAVAFNSDFPRVGAADPLVGFAARTQIRQRLDTTGAAMPGAESAESDLGFFTQTGAPFFRNVPESPYGGRVQVVRANVCPAAGAANTVYVCRPAARPSAVRVTAWGRSRSGAPLLVFDAVSGA
jgi:prepilin-type N-terminal cleavage/methylation domain-containing protein